MRYQKKKTFKCLLILSVATLLFSSTKTYAATLSLLPSPTTVSVGNIFSIKIVVDTENKFINNTEAVIQFPTDILEVVSVSKSSSIFSMWVEEPSYKNDTGKISLNGGLPNPGYNGSSGLVATITFRAKNHGTANILLNDAAVRENDGLGTDILSLSNNGVVDVIGSREINQPVGPNEIIINHAKPQIFSSTHPNQDLWYSNNTVTVNWKIPNEVTLIETLLNNRSNSSPSIQYNNSVIQKTFNNINDGVSYFHLGYIYKDGTNLISHYKINIDTIPPEPFFITKRVDNFNNIIKINAKDITSGIDYYEIKIDNDVPIKIQKTELTNNEFVLPFTEQGNHNLTVIAYDKAQNKRESSLSIFINNSVPKIYLETEEITKGESVKIYGQTDYPKTNVNVYLERKGKNIGKYSQTTGEDGSFEISTDKVQKSGYITITAETEFSNKAKSELSQAIYLKVNEIKAVEITLAIFYPIICLIVIIVILIVLMMSLYFGWHKYFGLKRKIKEESRRTIDEVHKEMESLKEELDSQLVILEKTKIDRNLNKKEEEIFAKIQRNVNKINDFIDKKLSKFKK